MVIGKFERKRYVVVMKLTTNVIKMLNKKIELEKIAKETGLSLNKVEEIKNEYYGLPSDEKLYDNLIHQNVLDVWDNDKDAIDDCEREMRIETIELKTQKQINEERKRKREQRKAHVKAEIEKIRRDK
ncbi:hypothetical protein [Halalkalibacter urbisdiaboli]|uniref:hypothetical protein n=1 Tax=Halalkalibacter urbisdiaboli TaxID=1960589 RepID=UPI000B43C5EA|nr:hypothetical protein [Halalkalibacter urbisdiaboli]